MGIAAQPPVGGIVGEVGGQSRPLRLGNGEIERFEAQHGVGIFAMLDQLVGLRGAPAPQVRHVRDLVALALVGGGLPDRAADGIVAALAPHENHRLRLLAHDALVMAFMPPAQAGETGQAEKKSDDPGSLAASSAPATSGTSPEKSQTPSSPD